MYTIKQMAELTGVKDATLRAWERRYALIEPTRSPGGYRLYTDADVDRVLAMAQLVLSGQPAAQAASAVQSGDLAADETDLDLVTVARTLDQAALRAVLARVFGRQAVADAVDDWLVPQLRAMGDAWENGDLGISEEHFVSAGLMRRLSTAFESAPTSTRPSVLFGLPPRDHHEIMTFALATVLRQRGFDTTYLGPDLPVSDWSAAVEARRPWGLVIAARTPEMTALVQEVVDAAGGAVNSPDEAPRCFVGGDGAALVARADALPPSIAGAADHIEARLARRPG